MKTIKTENIDGYKIVTAINDAAGFIDQIATAKIVDIEIQKTDVFKEIDKLKTDLNVAAKEAIAAMKNSQKALAAAQKLNPKAKTSPETDKHWGEYLIKAARAKEIEAELLPLGPKLKTEYTRLMFEHAIYFNLRPGEEYRDDSEAESIARKIEMAENAVIAIKDGKAVEVADYRGRSYWLKKSGTWTGTRIDRLGEKPQAGAILEADLSQAQREEIAAQAETERVAKMKPAEREAEKAGVLKSLAAAAASMRSELEIQGDADALAKSQAWYQAETEKINEKYGE